MTATMNNVFPPALKEAFGYRPRDHYFKREDPTCLTGWETFRVDAQGASPEQVWLLRFAKGEPRMALWERVLTDLVRNLAPMAHDPHFLCPVAVQASEDAVALRVPRPVGRSLWDVRAQQPNGRFDIATGRFLMQQVAQLAIRYCDNMERAGQRQTPALQLCASDIQVDIGPDGKLMLRLSPDICPSSRNNGFRPIFTPPMGAILSDYTAPIAELYCKVTGGETGRIHPPPEFPEKEKELLEQIFIHAEQSEETPWTDFLSDLLGIKGEAAPTPSAVPEAVHIPAPPPVQQPVAPQPVAVHQAVQPQPPVIATPRRMPPPPPPPPPQPPVQEPVRHVPEPVAVEPEPVRTITPVPQPFKPVQPQPAMAIVAKQPKPPVVDEPIDQWPPAPPVVGKPVQPKKESEFRKSADDWAKRFGAGSATPALTPAAPAKPAQPVQVQPAHRQPVTAFSQNTTGGSTAGSLVGGTKWVTSKPAPANAISGAQPPVKAPPPPPPYVAKPAPAATDNPKASSFDQVMAEFARMYK
ncbi:MAG TPA: hypothetical protein VK970_22775 [Candidatus Methylacidiphilales bacterium]|nr:hypothetical protein [Candidatus Methylacidiphilales bacterium]